MSTLVPSFKNFKIGKYNALAIYEYNDVFQKLLYQYKGCYDFELTSVFLNRYLNELRMFYKGYYIICAPSYYIEDKKREFNHVFSIFSELHFPIINAFEKTQNVKQANLHKNERESIGKLLKMSHLDCIKNKKILLVDDVYTTGATMRSMIKLVEQAKPKKIKILVLSKTIDLIMRIDKNA